MKVVSVRADKQTLAMRGGSLGGLLVETFSFAAISPGTVPFLVDVGIFHLYSLTTDGVLQHKVKMVNSFDGGADITDPSSLSYPITVPLGFAPIGGAVYVLEQVIDGVDGPAHPQLRSYSGNAFVNPTLIDIDTPDWTGTGIAGGLFVLIIFGSFLGTFFPVETDGQNVIIPASLTVSGDPVFFFDASADSFAPTGGARNESYPVESIPGSTVSSWVVDQNRTSFWLFNNVDGRVFHGPFNGGYDEIFNFSDVIFESGTLAIVLAAAVDFTDGFLYVLWQQNSSSLKVITKIDRDIGIVDRYTLSASRPGFTGTPLNIPYRLAADQGFLYVVGLSNVWSGSFNATWKINTTTGAGQDNPVFNACGIPLNAPLDAIAALGPDPTTDQINTVMGGLAGLFDLVTTITVSPGHNGTPNNLRQHGDTKVTSGLEMTHVPGDNQSQRSN